MEAKFASIRQQRIAQGGSHIEEQRLQLSVKTHSQGHYFQLQMSGRTENISFQLLLSPRFPLQAPRLTCSSHFTQPSIADGRDLLASVLGKPWTAGTSLTEVAAALPDFVVRDT